MLSSGCGRYAEAFQEISSGDVIQGQRIHHLPGTPENLEKTPRSRHVLLGVQRFMDCTLGAEKERDHVAGLEKRDKRLIFRAIKLARTMAHLNSGERRTLVCAVTGKKRPYNMTDYYDFLRQSFSKHVSPTLSWCGATLSLGQDLHHRRPGRFTCSAGQRG